MKNRKKQITSIFLIFGFSITSIVFISLILHLFSVEKSTIWFWIYVQLTFPFLLILSGFFFAKKDYINVKGERFEPYDIAYYLGSSIRPDITGVLKFNETEKSWFIVYDDGFEEYIQYTHLLMKWKKNT